MYEIINAVKLPVRHSCMYWRRTSATLSFIFKALLLQRCILQTLITSFYVAFAVFSYEKVSSDTSWCRRVALFKRRRRCR